MIRASRAKTITGGCKHWRPASPLLVLLAVSACGPVPEAEGPPDGINSVQQALSSINCTESTDTGYVQGSPFTITVVTVDGKKAEVKSANAYYVMAVAASKAGVNLKVVSGFRTMAEQTYLYNCYKCCCCNNCNLAAKPGYSNHQSGHAFDLNTGASGVLSWLNNHAAAYGFKRTVPSESWHWEWWGGGPGGGPCGKPTYPKLTINLSVETISGQERDLCQEGSSAKIFDWWVGQKTKANVDIKNKGTAVGKNVKIGLWAEQPYVEITHWNIYSDWKQAAGTFVLNDTDGMQSVPHDNPGKSFSLQLGSISPGETKRIVLKALASKASLNVANVDHPDLRAWVAKIEDYYAKASFSDKPSKNVKDYQTQNGGDLRDYFQTDVLDEESCDGLDNDCDGEIDESCTTAPDAGPQSDSGGSTADLWSWSWTEAGQPGGDGGGLGAELEGACALVPAGRAARPPLASLLLLLLLALALPRVRSSGR
jgi:hypothetical protein